ncbi:MAG: hypothetical protein RL196_120 [Actinomycetota bacterium]|jgi:DNA-binding FadR family transcriptional regulator
MNDFANLAETTSEPANTVARGSLLLTKIRGGNAYEETVERILQTIRLGLMHPGEQLPPERELALMLDVSRDTVRDATSSLAEAGYLVIRRGRYGGTFIADEVPTGAVRIGRDGELIKRAQLSAEEIRDTLMFRVVLESGAAYEAASTELNREARDNLWQAYLDTKNSSIEDYRRLDSRFHLLIGELSRSSSLVNQVAQSRMKVNELLDEIPLLQPNITHSNQQHEEIVMAILTGQAEKASAAMRAHLEGSASLLRGFLA